MVVAVASLLVVARRIVDLCLFEWTIHRLRSRRAMAVEPPVSPPHVLLLVPRLREVPFVDQICGWVERMNYPRSHLRVALVTTEREGGPEDESTTAAAIRQRLTQGADESLVHVHSADRRPLRAAQLNWALKALTGDYNSPTDTYVGVYNADSLPDGETLNLLAIMAVAEKTRGRAMPSAFQQPCRYHVPVAARSRMPAMHAAAALQTFWTVAHFTRRLLRSESVHRRRGMIPSIPIGFLGHGEFVRLDILTELGGFPDYGYADGLLLGWALAFRKREIRALPLFDSGEVPPSLRHLHAQHEAWFVGLLNLRLALRRAPLDATPGSSIMAARRAASTLSWALRAPLFVVFLLAALYLGVAPTVYAVGSVLVYGALPMVWIYLRAPELAPDPPGGGPLGWRDLVERLAGTVPAVFLDGVALWTVLCRMAFRRGAVPTPARTVRCHDKQ